ncbi:MAG: metallophosphoesterase [Actinomycetota bacterium]|nr:metallophosphoesterase [Actinomycetota bacterium]
MLASRTGRTALVWLGAVVLLSGCTAAEPGAGQAPERPPAEVSSTPGPPARIVRFTAAGDYSSSAEAEAVLAAIGEARPDVHVAVGDLSYGARGEEQAWCDLVTGHVGDELPFELLAGNHESDGRNGLIDDFAECLPNRLPGLEGEYGRQYFVDVPLNDPLVRFVLISPAVAFLDGVWDYGEGTDRYEWTSDAIDGARSAGIPWVVVGMHKPCHSMGEYPCEPGAEITNLLVEKGVNLVLSGHEHLYQRTHQLAVGGSCPRLVVHTYEPECVADDDSDHAAGAGTIFVTVGTGGVALRNVHRDDSDTPYFAAASGANEQPTWGFLAVEAGEATLAASFRPAIGSFEDSFTLTTAVGR